MPKIRPADNGTSSAAPNTVTTAGTKVLPVPRMTFASVLNSQIRMTPANTMLE
jgi:hypothetical protein